jgi:hypothetical protein
MIAERRASYAYQLDALAAAVLCGEPVKAAPEDAIENMTVVDAIDRAAGLPLTSRSER